MTYNPNETDINMEDAQEFEYHPPYGAFKAHIEECEAVPQTKDGNDYVRTTKKTGMPYVMLSLKISYMRGDQQKTDYVRLFPGLWFTPEIKSIMEVLKLTKEQAKDPKNYIGKDIVIVREGEKYRDNADNHIRSFQGIAVGEWNGKEYLIAQTTSFAAYKDFAKAADPGLIQKCEKIWNDFRENSEGVQESVDPKQATVEDVEEAFGGVAEDY